MNKKNKINIFFFSLFSSVVGSFFVCLFNYVSQRHWPYQLPCFCFLLFFCDFGGFGSSFSIFTWALFFSFKKKICSMSFFFFNLFFTSTIYSSEMGSFHVRFLTFEFPHSILVFLLFLNFESWKAYFDFPFFFSYF